MRKRRKSEKKPPPPSPSLPRKHQKITYLSIYLCTNIICPPFAIYSSNQVTRSTYSVLGLACHGGPLCNCNKHYNGYIRINYIVTSLCESGFYVSFCFDCDACGNGENRLEPNKWHVCVCVSVDVDWMMFWMKLLNTHYPIKTYIQFTDTAKKEQRIKILFTSFYTGSNTHKHTNEFSAWGEHISNPIWLCHCNTKQTLPT